MALKRAYTNGKATQLVANGDVLSILIEQQHSHKEDATPLNTTIRGLQLNYSTI